MPYYGYMGYGWGFDPLYLLIIVVSLVLGLFTQGYIKKTYAKWSRVPVRTNETGAEVARRMLRDEGASEVGITSVAGSLTDHYDPRDNKLHLSQDNLSGGSVASIAVACHEAGHAVQNARAYAPMRFRTALVPVVNFASGIWSLVLILGFVMNMSGFVLAGIVLFSFSVLFQLVTLPVEIDASRRALAYISSSGLDPVAEKGAREVLFAAALTYVAAALVSVLQLVYLLMRNSNRDLRGRC